MAASICGHAFHRVEAGARRKFDNGETAAWFQGTNQGGVEFGGFSQMVVDAAQENGVAAFGREIGIGVFAFEDRYVGQVALGNFGTQFGELVLVNLGGEDFAGG